MYYQRGVTVPSCYPEQVKKELSVPLSLLKKMKQAPHLAIKISAVAFSPQREAIP